MITFGRYSKFIVAAAGVLFIVAEALLDGGITGEEVEAVVAAVVVAAGVFGVTNK